MEKKLTFEYDEVGDTLYIQSVAPYAEQVSDALDYNVVVRRNPTTEVVEVVEIMFFTQWLLKHGEKSVKNLHELFHVPAAA